MNSHSFSTELAKEIGLNEAILLQHFYFWFKKNKANNKNFHDNNYWTYNSKKGFSEYFEYLTENQIKGALNRMKEKRLIITGNYNENKYDHTTWYAMTEKALSYFNDSIGEINQSIGEINQPIPDSNTNNNTNKEKINKKENLNELIESDLRFIEEDKEQIKIFLLDRKERKKPITERGLSSLLNNLKVLIDRGYKMQDCINRAIESNWTTIRNEWFKDNIQNNNNLIVMENINQYVGNSEQLTTTNRLSFGVSLGVNDVAIETIKIDQPIIKKTMDIYDKLESIYNSKSWFLSEDNKEHKIYQEAKKCIENIINNNTLTAKINNYLPIELKNTLFFAFQKYYLNIKGTLQNINIQAIFSEFIVKYENYDYISTLKALKTIKQSDRKEKESYDMLMQRFINKYKTDITFLMSQIYDKKNNINIFNI